MPLKRKLDDGLTEDGSISQSPRQASTQPSNQISEENSASGIEYRTVRYMPQPRLIIESYGPGNGMTLPQPAHMFAAHTAASHMVDVDLPEDVEKATYNGVDLNHVPTSAQLTQAAESGQIALSQTYFVDFLSAEYYRGALRPNKKEADSTIPLTSVAQKAHVNLLVAAFKNIQDTDDNPQMVKPFVERRHDSKLVEALCWTVLKAIIMRSNSEEPLVVAYEPYKSKNSQGLETFAKRFDAVVRSMTRSKTICKHLFDAPYINVFIDDPEKSIKRVEANRELNRQKGSIMRKGKQIHEEENNNQQGETPANKRRKHSPSASAKEDSPSSSVGTTRSGNRSHVVRLPLHGTPAPTVDRPVSRTNHASPTAPMISPIGSSVNGQISPALRPQVKQEVPSPPRRLAAAHGFASARPNMFGNNYGGMMPATGGFGAYQDVDFGFSQTLSPSFNPYTSDGFGNSALGMQGDFQPLSISLQPQAMAQFRQRQAQYTYNPGWGYGAINNQASTSAPTTPSSPGFTVAASMTEPTTTVATPSQRGYLIPEEITPAHEEDRIRKGAEANAEAEFHA